MEADNVETHSGLTRDASDLNLDVNGSPVLVKVAIPKSLQLSVDSTPPESKNSDASPVEGHSEKKRRARRKNKGGKHHRKWKPYSKLSWEEKKSLEEKEGRKAAQKREKRFASGQAMAPYNTTQFLMDLHDPDSSTFEPAKQRTRPRRESFNASANSTSDEYFSSNDDEEIFLEKEFSMDYENFQAEHIRSLSKEQLVKEYLELEEKCQRLEKTHRRSDSNTSNVGESADSTRTLVESDELQELRAENEQLRKENEQLRAERGQLLTQAAENEDKENNPDLEVAV